jgi:hypothetical protein
MRCSSGLHLRLFQQSHSNAVSAHTMSVSAADSGSTSPQPHLLSPGFVTKLSLLNAITVPTPRLCLQGCGLVEFAQHSEAAAALQTLDGKYVWRDGNRPMSVEWYSSSSSTQASNAPGQGPIQPLSFTGPGHMALVTWPCHMALVTLCRHHHQQQASACSCRRLESRCQSCRQ